MVLCFVVTAEMRHFKVVIDLIHNPDWIIVKKPEQSSVSSLLCYIFVFELLPCEQYRRLILTIGGPGSCMTSVHPHLQISWRPTEALRLTPAVWCCVWGQTGWGLLQGCGPESTASLCSGGVARRPARVVAEQTPTPHPPLQFHQMVPIQMSPPALNQALRDKTCLLWLIDGSR